ncbi:MAG: hypothetical protein K2H31_11370, partial [Lachnospiraceae bacterium]|nr:hypothetical protein [Lachnospiraceae bacterium]
MYVNGLGMRNIGQLQTTGSGSQKTSKINNFDDNMQKAVETWKAITKTGDGSDSSYTCLLYTYPR